MKRAAGDSGETSAPKRVRKAALRTAPTPKWTNDTCLICKAAKGPFPVLATGCVHPYCTDCARTKARALCDLCQRPWEKRCIHFEVDGKHVIAETVGGAFVGKYSSVSVIWPANRDNTSVKGIRRHYPEIWAEFVDRGLITRTPMDVRVARNSERMTSQRCTPSVYPQENGDVMMVLVRNNKILPVPHGYNVLYMPMDSAKVKASISNGEFEPINKWPVAALERAIQVLHEQEIQYK